MELKILDKFTTHLKDSLANSFKIAVELNCPIVSPLNLVYSLSLQKGSVAAEILNKSKVTKEKLKESLRLAADSTAKNIFSLGASSFPTLTTETQRALEKAVAIAWQNDHNYVGTEHLLLALVQIKDPELAAAFSEQNIDERSIEQFAQNVLTNTVRFPEIAALLNETPSPDHLKTKELPPATAKNKQRKKTPALDFFATDLTNPKNAHRKSDPLIGRAAETVRLMQILGRRFKNNPVLLGDPGVGKTAIVEGLAQKIIAGEAPPELADKKIFALDLGLVLAGTIYRGEFEGRLKQIIDEIKSDPRIIIFIDELHTLVGTGGGQGTLDAANILKPALARGEIRCIGATTPEEYKKHIESDAALERRFQPIMVGEPTAAETVEILKGLSPNYEKYHGIKITDEAMAAAVKLGARYFPDKFFPDKAIDLIDEAAAAKKLISKQSLTAKKIKQLEKKLERAQEAKERAVIAEKFDLAMKIKKEELELWQELAMLETNQAARQVQKFSGEITESDIIKVVSISSGVPVNHLESEKNSGLNQLEEEIGQFIFGQDSVVAAVARAIRRARLGLNPPDRPLASFILAGPSGVGKTELAKVIAKLIFKDPMALVRVDMSEFSESFQASKLIGSPAGYVGYKDGNKFTDAIKRRPYSVVLFDEIDKAHPEIFNLFLQILDEGRLSDATGRRINFKNTIVLMTTNIGSEHFSRPDLGFEPSREAGEMMAPDWSQIKSSVTKDLQNKFRREFLNRLDAVLVFNPLSWDALEKIAQSRIAELNERLKDRAVSLELTETARKLLVQKSLTKDQGARAITKIIQENIEEPLIDELLKESDQPREKILVDSDGQNLYLSNT